MRYQKRAKKYVYRVENALGVSPHMDDSLQDEPFQLESKNRPSPWDDFPKGFLRKCVFPRKRKSRYRSAFAKRSDAARWFGAPALRKLKKRGYSLKRLPAKEVVQSKSGRQVLFIKG